MGKRSREHRLIVTLGKERPTRHFGEDDPLMFCESCRVPVARSQIKAHLRERYHLCGKARFKKMEASHAEAILRPVG